MSPIGTSTDVLDTLCNNAGMKAKDGTLIPCVFH